MLIPLALLLTQKGDGIARFEQFMARTNSFSVQIAATSLRAGKATGSLQVSKPDSLRLRMKWAGEDYTFVKSALGSVHLEALQQTYMEQGAPPGLMPTPTPIVQAQEESFPMALLYGSFKPLVPNNAKFVLSGNTAGAETYVCKWKAREATGQVTVKIASDGKLVFFDYMFTTPMGRTQRAYTFSNYVLNPKVTANTFSIIPPLGYTVYQHPVIRPDWGVGTKLMWGTWQSEAGPAELGAIVPGKLLIVRDSDSPPSDRLVSFLQSKKLPVEWLTLSIGEGGGRYWKPPAGIARQLGEIGTPLMLLIDRQGVVSHMWLGFDPDSGEALIEDIKAAVAGEDEE